MEIPTSSHHSALDHLSGLEMEAIFIIREAVAGSQRPVLLFSGGKDSIVLLHLLRKAFFPATPPVPLLHVDTGHNFAETLAFRDAAARRWGLELIVASVEDEIQAGRLSDPTGPGATRNQLQTPVLLKALRNEKVDLAFGGARRDEERSRAKERIFSHRTVHGRWEPKNQRPELWNLYNTRAIRGEHFRVFPLSNWTELDIWLYIAREQIDLPELYFAHERQVFERDGMLYAALPEVYRDPEEHEFTAQVRFRTIGDTTCTGAIRSSAQAIEDILVELLTTRVTERGATRADDRASAAAMEERKSEGYF